MIGRGKLVEDLKVAQLVEPADRATDATTLYNGAAATAASGTGLDTRDYDEVVFVINAGTFTGDAQETCAVYHSATDDSTAATLVTGASFTAITTSNDKKLHIGSVICKNDHRYMWLRSVSSMSTGTSRFGAMAILGKSTGTPVTNSEVFDVDNG